MKLTRDHITEFVIVLLLIHISLVGVGQPIDKNLQRLKEQTVDFTGKTLNGQDFQLSDHKGKVVMLNFWSTRCGACNVELPDFNRLVRNFKDSAFVLISVIDETTEELTKAETTRYSLRIHPIKEGFYKYNKPIYGNDIIDFEIITDGTKIRKALSIPAYSPITLYLDKDGTVKDILGGYMATGAGQENINYRFHHNKIQWIFYGVNWDNKSSVIEISSNNNRNLDSLDISCDLVNLFPETEPEGVVVHNKEKVYIKISHQIPTTAYLSIENKRHYIFLIPHDTLKITLDENHRMINFEGIAGQINKYRRDKAEKFGDIIFAKYSIASNTSDLNLMKRKMGAFNRTEIEFLDEARPKYDLPAWFYRLEKNDINYLSASYKLATPAKRKYLNSMMET